MVRQAASLDDATRMVHFDFVSLPVAEDQRDGSKPFGLGDRENGGRVESAAGENDGPRSGSLALGQRDLLIPKVAPRIFRVDAEKPLPCSSPDDGLPPTRP